YKGAECPFLRAFLQQEARQPHADSADEAFPAGCFPVGCRVQHRKFGAGVVVSSDSAALIVDFEEAGEKKFLQASAGRFLRRV
ncbi:MAG: hypothetical protein ACI4LJ_02110, partial [Anaerovoracaceae bacterium]